MHNNNDNFSSRNTDIKVVLTYKPGVRKTPAKSGYRPLVKFEGKPELTSGEQKLMK